MRVALFHTGVVCGFLLINAAAVGQSIIYVNSGATGGNDGTSWTDAFASLQDALTLATDGDEVWVAAGTYRPDVGSGLTPGQRGHAFEIESGVRVLGGFAGNETTKGGRDRSTNISVLSGDLAGDDDGLVRREDNSYHVVRIEAADDNTLLEGFTIVGGQADGADADSLGGGIYVVGGAPWIINVRVNSSVGRCGGGIAVVGTAAPTLVNVVVNGNRAVQGGGVCVMNSDPKFINATITANIAYFGAGLYNVDASPTIANSIIYANRHTVESARCEVWQHPCALADVPADVLERDDAVMAGATDAFLNGSMLDAISYVREQADVVQVLTDSLAVTWRVAGGSLNSLIDGTGLPIDAEPFGKRAAAAHRPAGMATSPTAASSRIGSASPSTPGRSIIGEDWNGDGEINNRDGKRALVLSPFGFGDAEYAQAVLSETPGYSGGNTIYLDPWELRDDVALSALSFWDKFDFIYFSTFATEVCPEPEQSTVPLLCEIRVVATGRAQDIENLPYVDRGSVVVTADVSLDAVVVEDIALVGGRFFEWRYQSSLDHAVLFCSQCLITLGDGNLFWRTLSDGKSEFSFIHVINNEPALGLTYAGLDEAIQTALNALVVGDPAEQVIGATPHNLLLLAQYEFANPQRIIELPLLQLESEDAQVIAPMTELADVSDMIIGTIGDNEPDLMVIRELVYGVASEDDETRFTLNFEIGGNEIPGDYGLLSATPTGIDQVRDVRETIALGFPVQAGILPMKAIVDLGNGTKSTYVVNASVDAFSCSGKASFSGYESGVFTGTGWWGGDAEAGFISLTIESTNAILAKGPAPELGFAVSDYDLSFVGEGPEIVLTDDGFEMVFEDAYTVLTRRHTTNGWAARHSTTGGDCEECFARFFGSVDSEDVFEGGFEFLMNHSDASPSEPLLISGSGRFRAVPGSILSSATPYWQCADEYWTAYELLN